MSDGQRFGAGFDSTLKTNSTFSSNFLTSMPAKYRQSMQPMSMTNQAAVSKRSKVKGGKKGRNNAKLNLNEDITPDSNYKQA